MMCAKQSCLGPICNQPADHHGPHRSHDFIWTDESDKASATVIARSTERLNAELVDR